MFHAVARRGVLTLAVLAAPQVPPGHVRMLALLDQVAATRPANPYLGDAEIRRLEAALGRLRRAGPVEDELMLRHRLGRAYLHFGAIEKAIEQLGSAHQLVQRLDKEDPLALAERRRMHAYTLAVAYMRLAENQNCVMHHTADSCIFPIQGQGIHRLPEASGKAIELLNEVLRSAPAGSVDDLTARWLLNIAYMTVGGYPQSVPEAHLLEPSRFASEEEFPRFLDVAAQLGLDTSNLAGGAVVEDFDGDGRFDLLVSSWDPAAPMHLFHTDGAGKFTERTEQAGLAGLRGGINLVQADYDNDGDADVLVLRGAWLGRAGRHPKSLLRNDGRGRFTDVTFEAGLGEAHYPTQTGAWADYDNDGDLDLYVGSESERLDAFPGQLFRNKGDGTFVDVARQAGVTNLAYAKGVAWGDYDGDRFPDLYVSNLGGPNRLYRNNRDGTFTDVAPQLRVVAPRDSFAVWFWDFDNDGTLDLFVASHPQIPGASRLHAVAASTLGRPTRAERARLYRGNGRGGFDDVTDRQNLSRVTIAMGANFGDLDNDGFPDVYLGTGYPDYDGLIPNVMYRNRGGTGFADVSTAGGFGHLQKSNAVVFADLDDDGDQEVFEQMGGLYAGDAFRNVVYRNPGFGNSWLAVKLVGTRSNRSGIGARIKAEIVEDGRRRTVYKVVDSGGSFGANPLRQHLGLGRAQRVETLEIFWPTSGSTQTFHELPVNRVVRIVEGQPLKL